MTGTIAPHRVDAFNIAADSENKIHDDTVASRLGFAGGLVPGVAVFGYMAHLPVARWGRAWLERGSAECRFTQPVYDGEPAIASAVIEDDAMSIEVHSRDRLCATGTADLASSEPMPDPADYGHAPSPAPADRPVADDASLAEGTVLCVAPHTVDADASRQWLADLRETLPIFEQERLLHPATLLRIANWALVHNVVLGPWIHTASRVHNFAAMPVGAELSARAVVVRNGEQRGHRFVDLDVLVLIDGKRPAARISHSAIWRPRQLAAA